MNRRGLLGLLVGTPVAVAVGGADAVRTAFSGSSGRFSFGSTASASFINGGQILAGTIRTGYIRTGSADLGSIPADKLINPELQPGARTQLWSAPVLSQSSETRAIGLNVRLSETRDSIVWDAGIIVRREGRMPSESFAVPAGSHPLIGLDYTEVVWDPAETSRLRGRGLIIDPEIDDTPEDRSVPVCRWTSIDGLTVYLGAQPNDGSEWV